jgi:hypothetical protein
MIDTSYYYRLTNSYLGPNQSLDVNPDGSRRLRMAPTGNYSGQFWKFTNLGSGKYGLRTQYLGDGYSLDIVNDGTNNTPWLADSGRYSGQHWSLTDWGDGTFKLTNDFTGAASSLDTYSGTHEPFMGTGDHQGKHWTLTRLSARTLAPWCPFSRRNEASDNGGNYIDAPWRGVLHTVEGDRFSPQATYYGHRSWPHFTVVPPGQQNEGVWQHLPIDIAARALRNAPGGVETNRARCIQIELVGHASGSPAWADDYYRLIARLMRWIESQTLMLREGPRQTFLAWNTPGLALPTSAHRFPNQEWLGFNAWCGHQHVPENTHTDPGAIDPQRLGLP